MLYPLTFHPIFKERVWGGRNLERLFGKKPPQGSPIGESWEISDRSSDVSIVANGPLAGKDLHWLVENHRKELLGEAKLQAGRFPLLIKLLDAQDKLSLQVHPPANKAAELGGDPKTEMWFIADAAPGAELYVGLKHGVTKASFEQQLREGTVAECFHRISVRPGDAMFLPSGRVHAIGAGLVIFEIQQNSDTTYRVFDWNRVGLDYKPRELHVAQSLASINFNDFEPPLIKPETREGPNFTIQSLVKSELFAVDLIRIQSTDSMLLARSPMQIIGIVRGKAVVCSPNMSSGVELHSGDFCLIPACLNVEIFFERGTDYLKAAAS